MKIVILNQAIESLAEIMRFLLDQGIPIDSAEDMMIMLLDRAESLAKNPFKGQLEEYLINLNLDHRRIIMSLQKNSRYLI